MSNPDSDHQESFIQLTTSNATTQTRLTRLTTKTQSATDHQLTDKDLQDVIQTANSAIQKLEKSKKTYDKKKDHLTLLKLDELNLVITFWTKLHNSALNQLNQDPSLRIKIQDDYAAVACEVQSLNKKNKYLITRLKETQEKLTSAEHRIGYLDTLDKFQARVANMPQRPQQPNVNIQDDVEMANLITSLTESLQEILSHQHKQQIPFYNGLLNDQPIEDWYKDAERVAKTAGWTDALKLKYFSDRLRGVAATYNDEFATTNQQADYQDWKEAMITRFQDSDAKERHEMELHHLQQGPNQRVNDFKSFIDQKFIKAYGTNAAQSGDAEMTQIREDIKKKVLLKGLKPKIVEQLWHRIDPTNNYDSIVSEAINVEKLLQRRDSMTSTRSTGINTIQTILE